ncbi:histone H1-like [Venturia canescens]|uniref:histone H1-like n=1 Tax=Venturia canescens TaxID=32260 RepID=UPI001C9BD394|nr:histone H1-like [Venturia canescens]
MPRRKTASYLRILDRRREERIELQRKIQAAAKQTSRILPPAPSPAADTGAPRPKTNQPPAETSDSPDTRPRPLRPTARKPATAVSHPDVVKAITRVVTRPKSLAAAANTTRQIISVSPKKRPSVVRPTPASPSAIVRRLKEKNATPRQSKIQLI